MKTVMLFGTFDMIHPGHIDLFRQARQLGSFLIAVVARDKTVEQVKKRLPRNSERRRAGQLRRSGLLDKVVLGSLTDNYAAIKKYQPDVIALGYDQIFLTSNLKDQLRALGLEARVVRLKPYQPHIFKTSKLLK